MLCLVTLQVSVATLSGISRCISVYSSWDSKKLKKTDSIVRRPTGMNREVYALLCADATMRYVIDGWVAMEEKDAILSPSLFYFPHFLPSAPSLVPTDTGCGYRQPKARLGRKHVRPWKWMPFTNIARTVRRDSEKERKREREGEREMSLGGWLVGKSIHHLAAAALLLA